MTPASLATATLVSLGQISNRTFVLPLVIFYATSRCNSRCISCDWWKHTGSDDLSLDEIGVIADATARLGTRVVVFSGGEPLLRPDVFEAAQLFRRRTITLHLLSSGLLLERQHPPAEGLDGELGGEEHRVRAGPGPQSGCFNGQHDGTETL